MKLSEALSASRIQLNLKSTCKKDAIAELVALAVADGCISSADRFVKKIMAREEIHSTGLAEGIAIPHAQDATVDEVITCLGVCREGIEFNSNDEQPAQLIFLVAADEHHDAAYLGLLSQIVRIFRPAAIRGQVLAAQSAHDIIQIITKQEQILAGEVHRIHHDRLTVGKPGPSS